MSSQDLSQYQEKIAHIKTRIPSFEGAEAIFEESGNVTHVRVSQVTETPEIVEVVITDLRTPGMGQLSRSSGKISCRWELLNFDGEHWTANLPIRWQLNFDAETVEILKEMAAVLGRRSATVSSTIAHEVRRVRFEMRFPNLRAARRGGKR